MARRKTAQNQTTIAKIVVLTKGASVPIAVFSEGLVSVLGAKRKECESAPDGHKPNPARSALPAIKNSATGRKYPMTKLRSNNFDNAPNTQFSSRIYPKFPTTLLARRPREVGSPAPRAG